MIDFKVKGTKLPNMKSTTEYRFMHWDSNKPDCLFIYNMQMVSYGSVLYNNETWILAEPNGYSCVKHYMIRESDILKLAKEQGMIDFILPEKWKVKYNEISQAILDDWRRSNGADMDYHELDNWVISDPYEDNSWMIYGDDDEYEEITFKQFKEHVLNSKGKIMEKKLLGYKLKELDYSIAAVKIEGNRICGISNIKTMIFNSKDHYNAIHSWKEAKVLDKWFEEVYEDIIEFKVGDYVWMDKHHNDIKSFGKIIDLKCHYTNCVFINKIDGPHCSGQWNRDRLTLATEDEILEYLQKEFTERTSIGIGSEITEENPVIKGNWHNGEVAGFTLLDKLNKNGKNSALSDAWFKENPNERYQLIIEAKYGTYSPRCILAKPKLTFGGIKVTLEKVSSGVRVICNGEIGTLSQLEKIYIRMMAIKQQLKFGSVIVESVEFSDKIKSTKPLGSNPIKITIGCTTGTWEEFVNVLEAARKLKD